MTFTTQPSGAVMAFRGLSSGVLGGLAGGVVFGLIMQAMGLLPQVAMLVGGEGVAVGWLTHLAISAFFGGTFGMVVGSRVSAWAPMVALGAGYGVFLWVVGALLIMPARLGMPMFEINTTTLQSLVGHIVFGAVLGVVHLAVSRNVRP